MEDIKSFLKRHWSGEKPLLLGYSGGPDSKALLYSLLEAGCKKLHIAHIDHGWREESRGEAASLRREAEQLGLPFHSTRLQRVAEGGNREERAREERLRYFRTLCAAHSCEALLLGHQADDLAETVLKRVFEGAHLSFLGGMEEVSAIEGMPIWRPLLQTPRSRILQFLEERSLAPLLDPTNADPTYLRSRLRTDLFPYLTRVFGKEIRQNLELLAERSSELKHYLDRKIAPHPVLRGPWGLASDLHSLDRIEKRHFLQKLSPRWPRTLLEPLLDWLEQKKGNRLASFAGQKRIADRGWIFALASPFPALGPPLAIREEGIYRSGDWEIEARREERELLRPDWTAVWKGEFSLQLPVGAYTLRLPPQLPFKNRAKAPAFLRQSLPVFYQENEPIADFLSGKALPEKGPVLKLILRIIK